MEQFALLGYLGGKSQEMTDAFQPHPALGDKVGNAGLL